MKDIRYSKILQMIEERNLLKVTDAAKILNFTSMTIRRDLLELENAGLLVRIHAGQKGRLPINFLSCHIMKRKLYILKKRD